MSTRRLRGHASIFGVRNAEGEIFMPGAFGKVCERVTAGERLPFFFVHGHVVIGRNHWGEETRTRGVGMSAVPVGTVDVLSEDALGLYYEAQLFDEGIHPLADALLAAVDAGAVRGASIGFVTGTAVADIIMVDDIPTVIMHEVELVEISACSLLGSDRLAYVELAPDTTTEPPAGEDSAESAPAVAGEGKH